MNSDTPRFETRAVHAGELHTEYQSLHVPIFHTASYFFANTNELIDFVEKKSARFEYARYGNPTQRSLEEKIMQLESAEDALIVSSGMAALGVMALALLSNGDHILFTSDSYLKSRHLIENTLPRFGITASICDTDSAAIEAAMKEHPQTKMIFTECPTNPLFRIIDLEALCRLCKQNNIISVVDSTLASPVNLNPLTYGIDLIIHSLTKYFSGHNDIIAGLIAGKSDLMEKVRSFNGELGAIASPMSCYQLLRSTKTLKVRMEKQNSSGLKIAQFLENHPAVQRVLYPGLPSNPDYELAKKQLRGHGGLLTFEVKGNFETMRKFCDSCKIFRIGPSFAGPESLIDPPVIMSHWDVSPENREKMGINERMIRLAIGLEDTEDLINDINQALEYAGSSI